MPSLFRLICVGCLGCLCVVLAGCRPEYSGSKRYSLTGKVTFNGEPVDLGSISFIPLGADQRVSGGEIVDGTYTVPEERGANAGKHRIEIHWQKKTGEVILHHYEGKPPVEEFVRTEGIPAEFHSESTLTADVGDNKTTFDFDLKSDKLPSAPRKSSLPEERPAGL